MKKTLGVLLFLMVISPACAVSTNTPISTKTTSTVSPTGQPTASITPTLEEPSPTYPPLGGTAIAHETEGALFETQLAGFDVEALRCETSHDLPWPITFSPDGQWMTAYCYHDGGNLSLLNKDGTTWKLRDRDIFSTVKNSVYEPLFWSNDKESLYLTTSGSLETAMFPETSDGSWCAAKYDVITLIEFNYKTGTHEIILGNQYSYESPTPNSYSIAISPSESLLAYSLQIRTSTNISIKKLDGTAESTISMNEINGDTIVNSLLWSPDESKLLAVASMCDSKKAKLFLVDVKNGNTTTIPIEIPEEYNIQKWVNPNLVVITTFSNGNLDYYYLDLSKEKIIGPIQ
ncbi:MAG: hypothetical protein QM730_29030 [Anaerolineales bacterium]